MDFAEAKLDRAGGDREVQGYEGDERVVNTFFIKFPPFFFANIRRMGWPGRGVSAWRTNGKRKRG
jgi:hypothetical protein